MLLTDFDSWPMVYWWFRRIVRRLLLCTLYDVALMLVREREGRKASPAAGVIDGQSLKMPGATHGGVYEASKRIRECKCYVTVETDRSLLMVHLTPADVQDVAGDEAIMSANRCHWS